ncbi:MAG: hypothetical protein BJ554DRAFT_3000 [Olpidium bornovanus]|uniref:Cytochrome b5 heme-binding domain-containing protein n=1 Tax=Olpidium bornovanus TaxID=278681 RepID=A0A8H7ZQ66_9FUNG|nr:MAG: hypothetical protein BJ554DRAFT_3000 [Olpidium bornovanus]
MLDALAAFAAQVTESPVNWCVRARASACAALAALVLYLFQAFWKIRRQAGPAEEEVKHPKTVVYRRFTPRELAEHDGRDTTEIYLAVKRKVFDVSPGRSFYGPGRELLFVAVFLFIRFRFSFRLSGREGLVVIVARRRPAEASHLTRQARFSARPATDGPYGNFAGRDASRGLAYNSFDASVLTALDGPIDELRDLTEEQKQSLDEWFSHFAKKCVRRGRSVGQRGKGGEIVGGGGRVSLHGSAAVTPVTY